MSLKNKKLVKVFLDPDLIKALNEMKKDEKTTLSSLINQVLKSHLEIPKSKKARKLRERERIASVLKG